MDDYLNITTTSAPNTYNYEKPDSFLKSMGLLLLHVAIAGAALAVLIGLLVLSHTIYMRFFKKQKYFKKCYHKCWIDNKISLIMYFCELLNFFPSKNVLTCIYVRGSNEI